MTKKINNFTKLFFLFGLVAAVALPAFALAEAPVVYTQGATNIDVISAELNGFITNHGKHQYGFYTKSTVWFQYGKTPSYGSETTHRLLEETGSFAAKALELSSCTVYHFRAVAENGSEKAYGEDRIFTTTCRVGAKVEVFVQDITLADGKWYKQVNVNPFDKLLFKIVVESIGKTRADNVKVKNNLPLNIVYQQNLKISGENDTRNIAADSINIGSLTPGASKTITFEAIVGPATDFEYGVNNLIDTAYVYTAETTHSDSCALAVVRGAALAGAGTRVNGGPSQTAGAGATAVGTGIATDILHSFLLPMGIALVLVWLLKSQFIGLDKFVEKRRNKIEDYRAEKELERIRKKMK